MGKTPNKQTASPVKASKNPRRSSTCAAFRSYDYLSAGGISMISFCVYLFTMARSIPPIDGGELTTVLWTYGIAHPTGYPLFSMLGGLFVHVPWTSEVAIRANLFANVCTSLAAGLFYLVFAKALIVMSPQTDPPAGQKDLRPPAPRRAPTLTERAVATLTALSLAFSRTFWDQSNSVEVYPLQLLLFAAILLTWLHFYESPSRKRAFLAGLVLGAGFTNHMTTILTVPALAFLVILMQRDRAFRIAYILPFIFGGAIAGSLYIYLPLRAASSPLMNWGDPETFKRFFWHVSGKQFRVWMFSSPEVFQKQLGVFFSSLYPEFRITLLPIAVGLILTAGKSRRYFLWVVLLLVGDILYAANYNIHDIASYFLLAYISLALCSLPGMIWIVEQLTKRTKLKRAAMASMLIFPIVSAVSNFNAVDESKDYSVGQYTRDILTSLPKNSVVIGYQWDNFVSASIYYQHVDSVRPDVTVIDKELLRRSWYTTDVHTRFPFLFPSIDRLYSVYMDNLRLFENDLPYDPRAIEKSYSDFIREIISGAQNSGREVFVGPELEDQYLSGYRKVPYGLLYELRTDTAYVPPPRQSLDGFVAAKLVDTDYSKQILEFYVRMFYARAAYEYSNARLADARTWLERTLAVDPTFQPAETAEAQLSATVKAK